MEEVLDIATIKMLKYKCLKSSLFFTRYFFYQQYNRKFVQGNHHKLICEKLDAVLRGEIKRLIINIAPRYSKTEIAVKAFIANGLALNPSAKFIHLSYSDDLVLDNSETIRDLVATPEYQLLFPEVEVKKNSDSKKKWYTTAGGGVYATAAGGAITGFGAGKVDIEDAEEISAFINPIELKQGFGGAIIIDDPLKPVDADSEIVRERVNQRFDSTISNRVNSRNTPIIIIMQRLHERDLCGYLMENEPGVWEVLSLPCIQEDENGQEVALWPFKHSLEELKVMQTRNPLVFGRQYLQNPQPREGLLYSTFKTYSVIPISKRTVRKSYTDTADEGSDFLCSIVYDETEFGCFVPNDPKAIIYTQDKMENTEPLTARQFTFLKVDAALIESNNGGKGFARNVGRDSILLGNSKTRVNWFHQSDNKQVRIFTKQADVNNLIHFPEGWDKMWPVFYRHVTSYSATGKNAHDDAPDTLTGITENFGKGGPIKAVTKEQLGFS